VKIQKLKLILQKAVAKYNKYRSPEVTARVLSGNERLFEIEFKGPFCHTCGFYDYFDDLRALLEDFGIKTKVTEVKEIDEGAIVILEVIGSHALSMNNRPGSSR